MSGGHWPSVSGCAARYWSSTCGVGSAVYDAVTPNDHAGGESCCDSVHAACRAAPNATYSAGVGTCTGAPQIAGAMRRTASERAPPPTRMMRLHLDALRGDLLDAVGHRAEQALDRGASDVGGR